jgi:hypothetical protein
MEPSATLKELRVGLKPHEKIFAVDINQSGKKKFLRGNRTQYIQTYEKARSSNNAHWYEIILEDRPCPLVLDIESTEKHYMKTVEAVETLMKLFSIAIHSKTNEEDEYIFLDSSNTKKVSLHVVGKVLFKNLAHVGAVVRTVWTAIQSLFSGEIDFPPEINVDHLRYLFEKNNQWIIDDCIYTRNRFFRIPFSRKKGSDRVLKPMRGFGRQVNHWSEMLVQKTNSGGSVHEVDEVCGSDPIFTSMPAHRCMQRVGETWMLVEKKRNNPQTDCVSVHPFLEPVLNKLDEMGYMLKRDLKFNSARRSWCVNTNSKKCGIANREHAGNHIWFEIDGLGGRVLQRCYDNNCVGFCEVDVDGAWDEWTAAWSTMVDITDMLSGLDRATSGTLMD